MPMPNRARILDPQRRSRGACHYCHFEPAGLCRLHLICQLLTSFFLSPSQSGSHARVCLCNDTSSTARIPFCAPPPTFEPVAAVSLAQLMRNGCMSHAQLGCIPTVEKLGDCVSDAQKQTSSGILPQIHQNTFVPPTQPLRPLGQSLPVNDAIRRPPRHKLTTLLGTTAKYMLSMSSP